MLSHHLHLHPHLLAHTHPLWLLLISLLLLLGCLSVDALSRPPRRYSSRRSVWVMAAWLVVQIRG